MVVLAIVVAIVSRPGFSGGLELNAYAFGGTITASVARLHWLSADGTGGGPAPWR